MNDKNHKGEPDPKLKGEQRADENDTDNEFLERWKDSDANRMGNDIASEINIANSHGTLEGGSDNRWHMEDDETSEGKEKPGN